MNGIFSPDSKFMQLLNRIADIMILNIIYLITCIPLFTIGAATTALYSVCFKLGTEDEGSLLSGYFRAFRDNFKQATILWLILFVLGFNIVFYFFYFFNMQNALHYVCVPLVTLLLLFAMAASYTFPLLSQFQNTVPKTLRNAAIFCIAFLPRSFVIVVINLIPVIVFAVSPYHFLMASIFWFAFFFSLAALLNVKILRKIFSPYYDEESSDPE